jgi:uncharacterized protein YjdB
MKRSTNLKKKGFFFAVSTVLLLVAVNSPYPVATQAATPQTTRIDISPSWTSLSVGDTFQFQATAFDQFGNPMSPQPTFIWSSWNVYFSVIDGNGLMTAMHAGQNTLYVKAGGATGAAYVSIVPPTVPVLSSITVSPPNSTIASGATQQLTATALDQNWTPLVPQPTFSWSSNTYLATVDSNGLVTGISQGPATITATSGLYSGTAAVSVGSQAAVFTSIQVSPANPVVASGATQQFSATALDQNGNAMATQPTFNWTSGATSTGTIDATGQFSSLSSGTSVITATSGSVSGSTTVTVNAPTPILSTISISPANSSINVGSTQQMTADKRDQNGNPISAAVNWSCDNPSVGTVDPVTGFFSAMKAGSTIITAISQGNISGTTVVTVNPLIVPKTNLSITGISVVNLTKSSATVHIETTGDSGAIVSFSKNKKNVAKKKSLARASDNVTDTKHDIVLAGLKKKTAYYFFTQVQTADSSQTVLSGVLGFKTLKK